MILHLKSSTEATLYDVWFENIYSCRSELAILPGVILSSFGFFRFIMLYVVYNIALDKFSTWKLLNNQQIRLNWVNLFQSENLFTCLNHSFFLFCSELHNIILNFTWSRRDYNLPFMSNLKMKVSTVKNSLIKSLSFSPYSMESRELSSFLLVVHFIQNWWSLHKNLSEECWSL